MSISWRLASTCAGLALATSASAVAQTAGRPEPATHTIAVLVKVDRRGSVMALQPDVILQPALRNLLRQTLERIITQPAHDTHGKPVASQIVMQFSVRATHMPDGPYRAAFTYLSAKAIPNGHWVWKRVHQSEQPSLIREGNVANVENERAKRLRRFKANHGIQGPMSQQKRRGVMSQHRGPIH